MASIANGKRMNKEELIRIKEYTVNILKNLSFYKKSVISGSFWTKETFGDLDLVCYFDKEDKKEIKKDLISLFKNYSENFYKEQWYYNSGEIITVKLLGAQVDIIISTSIQELDYKQSFLALPAYKQALAIGLVKLGNKQVSINQELDWNLSTTGLSTRLITYQDSIKESLRTSFIELDREEVFRTQDFNFLERMLNKHNFSLNDSFKEMIDKIKKLSRRDINRIKGLFNSLYSIKKNDSLEKIKEKEYYINIVKELNTYKSLGVFVGRLQPCTSGHKSIFEKMKHNEHNIIFLVHSGKVSLRNPFDLDSRLRQLGKVLDSIGSNFEIKVISTGFFLDDLDNFLDKKYSNTKVTLYCGSDRYSNYKQMIKYSKYIINIEEVDRAINSISGTEVRDNKELFLTEVPYYEIYKEKDRNEKM